jgi:hypothetical protein
VENRLSRWGGDLVAALRFPLSSPRRAVVTTLAAVVVYLLLILSTFPEYSIQMLGAGVGYLDTAVVALTRTTYRSVGWVGLGLIVVYGVLTGVALTNMVAQVRYQGVSDASDAVGLVPGLVASGCASCGAGLLGFLGFAGVLAAMPFHGNLLRVGGLVLLVGVLVRTGDPRTCRLPAN